MLKKAARAADRSAYVIAVLGAWETLPADHVVGSDVACAIEGDVSVDTLDRRVKAGAFPPPCKIPGSRLNYWRVGSLREHMRRRWASAEG